jgi:hypothetical protein
LIYPDEDKKDTPNNAFQYIYYHFHFVVCAESSASSFNIFFSKKS